MGGEPESPGANASRDILPNIATLVPEQAEPLVSESTASCSGSGLEKG